MHSQAKQALLKRLMARAEHLEPNPTEQPASGLSWPQPDGRVLHLREPWAQEIRDEAINLVSKPPWNDRFTPEYLRKCLSMVLVQAFDGGKDAASAMLDSLVEMLDTYATERQIYVPITGIELAVPELKIGQVTLKRFDDSLFERFATQIDRYSENHPPEQVEGGNHFKELGRQQLYGKVCAEFITVAEPDRGYERANEEARRAIELVTFACIAQLPPDAPQSNIVIGLDGEVPRIGPWILSMSEKEINSTHRAPISAMPITINADSISGLQHVGALVLSDLLSRPQHELSDWEESLIRAVHWLATSQAQVELQNRLLNLNTAIETLLTDSRGGITAQVAESVALLIGRSFEERKQIKTFISRMYRQRSAVSHGGAKTLIEADVNNLRRMVARLITTLVRHKDQWTSKDQVNGWLERKRLGD